MRNTVTMAATLVTLINNLARLAARAAVRLSSLMLLAAIYAAFSVAVALLWAWHESESQRKSLMEKTDRP